MALFFKKLRTTRDIDEKRRLHELRLECRGEGPGGQERALLDSLLTQLRLMVDKVEAEREKAATLVLQAQHLQDEEDSSVSAERSDEDGDEVPGLAQ